MTCVLKLRRPIINFEEPMWFNKSYGTIEDLDTKDVDDADAEYERKFNVKLIYGQPEENETMRPIIAVEFESESEATRFMLEWA